MTLDMAWRNIWRNPRRTGVIMTAVVIGVLSMILIGAVMKGMAVDMVKQGIDTLTGHLQIHQKEYRSDPVIENNIKEPAEVEKILAEALPGKSVWAARMRVNAIAMNARHSAGITLVGIDPIKEARISFIGKAVTEGRQVNPGELNAIVIGKALFDKFGSKMGHKLVLMSQEATGQIASRSFRVVGVFHDELEATEKQFVFVSLAAARRMLGAPLGISEFSVLLPDRDLAEPVADLLRAKLPADTEASSWREILPLLSAYLDIMDGFIAIWYLVVFVAMGFGIVNTTLMAVYERMREFGLLKSLGMKPRLIIAEVLAEAGFILVLGMAMGSLLGVAAVAILAHTGIDLSALADARQYLGMTRMIYPVLDITDLLLANSVVLFLGLLVSAYPALKAARITPVEAMSHV